MCFAAAMKNLTLMAPVPDVWCELAAL